MGEELLGDEFGPVETLFLIGLQILLILDDNSNIFGGHQPHIHLRQIPHLTMLAILLKQRIKMHLIPLLNTFLHILKHNPPDQRTLIRQLRITLQILRHEVIKLHHSPPTEEQLFGLLVLVDFAEGVATADIVQVHFVAGVHFVL